MANNMTPQEFIAKWKKAQLSERSAAQQHFLDLCELLGQPNGCEERTIVELKHLDAHLPSWLAAYGGARGYSKFAQAMRCVHGVGEECAAVG